MKILINIQIVFLILFSSAPFACPFDIEVIFISGQQNKLSQPIEEGDQFLISSCNGERQEVAEVNSDLVISLSQGTEFDGSTMTREEAKEKIKDISLMLITNSGVKVKPNSPNQSLQSDAPEARR